MKRSNGDETSTVQRSRDNWERIGLVALLLILGLAAYFRFTGIGWDADTHIHPDERFLTETTSLLQTTTNPLTYLRSSESPLSPYNVNKTFYVYGNFPMTVTRYVAEAVDRYCFAQPDRCDYIYTNYTGVHIIGRIMSASMDMLSVFFIFLIGARLYNWRVGLLASLLLALAVMPIQQSHFYTMDNWAAALTTITMYFAVRASEEAHKLRWWVLFGVLLGLTIASRINVAPLALMAGVAGLIWLAKQVSSFAELWTPAGSEKLQRVIIGGVLAALVSILTFRLAQPYAFADAALINEAHLAETGEEASALQQVIGSVIGFNPQFLSNMDEIQRLQAPESSFPPALQWTDRAAITFPLVNMVLYGMGITAAITAWIGFFWAASRIMKQKPEWAAHALPVAWVGLYFLFMGTRWVKSIRYFLPIYPFLLLLAAWALWMVWLWAGERLKRRLLATAATLVVIVPSFLWANAFVQIYQEPITRVAASDWMLEHVDSGATLLYELDGEARQIQLPIRRASLEVGTSPIFVDFSLPDGGTVIGVRFNYLSDAGISQDPKTMALSFAQGTPSARELVQFTLTEERQQVTFPVTPIALAPGEQMQFQAALVEGTGVLVDTSVIAVEHWDDALPVRYNGIDPYGRYYNGLPDGQMPVTIPDDPSKQTNMLRWLDEMDYMVISSSKFIWSLPRLPLTYPMMNTFYASLFNGELGFELVGEFHADLSIGPLHISDTTGQLGWGEPPSVGWPPPGDLAAEEAFSVYDHPPVWIFEKTEAFTPEVAQRVIGSVDLSQQITMNPAQATEAPNGLLLTEAAFAEQRANGTFRELFSVDGIFTQLPGLGAIIWWLTVILFGLLAFPLCYVIFRPLPSKGYLLGRILALLLISYFAWITASLNILPHTRGTLLLGLAMMVILSTLAFVKHRQGILGFFREQRRFIITAELIAIGLYCFSILIRLGNPDVWDVIWGGEKPFDFSYFNAVMKSTSFPPYHPWYAGGYINYYYYGYVYVGSITKILGVLPAVAYNLILPMLFSFTGMGAFSIAYDLVARLGWRERAENGRNVFNRAIAAGVVAAMLCVILGNLGELGVVFNAWNRAGDTSISSGVVAVDTVVQTIDGAFNMIIGGQNAPIHPGDWFWTASRALNADPGEAAPITEFPFFTFLYGDLHAHMINMPLMLFALAWAVSYALQDFNRPRTAAENLLIWVIGGLAIGVLQPTNTWDWPTYMVIGSLAILYANYRQAQGFSLTMLGRAGLQILVVMGLSSLAFLPFSQNYGIGYASIKLWEGSTSHLSRYLTVYGLFLFIISTFLIREVRLWARTLSRERLAKFEHLGMTIVIALVGYVGVVLLMVLRGYMITPVVLTMVVVAGLLGLQKNLPSERRIILILISAALFLTLAVEIFVIDGDIGRMNMVFKFYVQVWLILSVIAGAGLVWSWPNIQARQTMWRRSWQVTLGVLVFIAALYPVLATKAKWDIRMSKDAPNTLNGMAFMEYAQYNDRGQVISLETDYDAIMWMYRNIDGSPVIAEGHSDNPYRSIGNRIAMYTGLPAIVGWDWHLRQHRAVLPGTLVSSRIRDVNNLYNTASVPEAMQLLEKYEVEYVYAGQLEWVYYSPEGLRKFDEMTDMGYLEEVYRNEGVSIYKVLGG